MENVILAEVLASILVKTGIVDAMAVDDPEGYDMHATREAINEAAVLINAEISERLATLAPTADALPYIVTVSAADAATLPPSKS